MNLQTLNTIEKRFDFGKFPKSEISETERTFSLALQKIAVPLLGWSAFSLEYFSPSGELISRVGIGCKCDKAKNSPNQHIEREISFERVNLGTINLCCCSSFANADQYLRQLIEDVSAELNRQADEAAMFTELGMSWESLQAVYDLTADLSAHHNPQTLLEKIIERATSIGEDTCAVLWIEDAENLNPVTSTNIIGMEPRAKNYGLIGKVFTEKSSVICDDAATLKIIAGEEIELLNAVRVAAFPIATQIKNYGVLAVWQKNKVTVFDSRTTRLLDTLALQAAMVIETECLHRESIKSEKLQQEIEIGSNIQQILLNGNLPTGIRGVKISAITIPSKQIDGDFYDFIEYGDDCFDLIIGDVMGKGIPAALVGAATKNYFLRAIGQLQSVENDSRPAPEKIVGWVNGEVTAKLAQFESFVTACYARFDLEKNLLTFVDCGHTKTIFYNRRARKLSILEGDNVPLGFSEREIFNEQTIGFEPGDVLFFFSDGITEARNAGGEFYGDERLAEFISRNASQDPKKLISDLLETLQKFSGEKNFRDDLTCVAVQIEESPPVDSHWKIQLTLDSDLRVLADARQFVREAAQILFGGAVSDEFIEQFEIAITEAVTNIIRHAYQNQKGNRIDLIAENCGEELQISLVYTGEEFDPKTAAPPAFDGSCEGGFGLFIISNCVDEVVYSHDFGNRSTICLKKKRKLIKEFI